MKKVFLTGITGLVGSAFVVALLREREDFEIVCLARKSPVKSALQRTQEIIRDECEFNGCPEAADMVLSRVSVIEGDVTTIDPEAMAKDPILAGTDIIFHCAADVNLGKDPTGKTYRINYHGTENMVALAKLLNVKEFHYVGTSYIAGKLVGTAIEDNPLDSGFNNPYEESKYKAEMLVRASGIPFSVYRPAIITGRRSDGRIRKPLAFYRILEFMAKLKSNKCAKMGVDPRENIDLDINFSAVPSEHIYFVPIDYVQEAITALFQKPVCNRAYHITGDSPISNKQIQLAIGNALNISGITVDPTQDGVGSNANMMSRLLGDLLPYFSSDIVFDQSNVRKALGDEILDWEYGVKSLEALVKSFYVDHFSDTDWIQDLMKR
ncbi:MAG: SDR family oxidoreductase [Lentisphaeria bacterium]|nr:SDR family oxidoreductase [Lentisphaeria bacterium]MBQ8754046.1 SDR family oxidoreductase [Lentisphaeria bacterium]